ncbi:MAG: glycosyltransferase family 4 protein [Rhodothermales bacterium]|nr:glycosyltransferase family 4 protein [Rhodothermales bacterium]
MPRPTLLYTYLTPSSFVTDDLGVLSQAFDVRTFRFDAQQAKSATGLARLWIMQAAWLARYAHRADVQYGWFADHHLALPALLSPRLPLAVALGGFEANTLPEIGYGVMTTWRAPLARLVLRRAALLLPVASELLVATNRFGAFPHVLETGVRARVPGLVAPAEVLPTGYDLAAWPMGPDERKPSVLTVTFVSDARAVRLKGIDLLLEAARRMPDVPFTVVGVSESVARTLDAPPNATLLPAVPRADLARRYAEASVFALFSRSEGLPNVVAEAMACGAVPVVSAVGGMPSLVGETGEVVETPAVEVLVTALRRGLAASPARRHAARARIAADFSAEARRERLVAALMRLARR